MGTRPTRDHGAIEVLVTGRYESVVRIPGAGPGVDSKIVIPIFPDIAGNAGRYEKRISENTIARYGAGSTLLKDTDPRKRYIEGACVVNPGGNACLPVYGAFLATGYLGFKDPEADAAGLAVSGSALALPVRASFVADGLLRPFFPLGTRRRQDARHAADADVSVGVVSAHRERRVFRPACGAVLALGDFAALLRGPRRLRGALLGRRSRWRAVLQGGRLSGWGFFVSEMSLGACSAYYFDDTEKGRVLLAALGALKLADIAAAFFMRTGYDVYNRETADDRTSLVPFLQMRELPGGEGIMMLGMSYRH